MTIRTAVPTDAELVAATRAGDDRAFVELLQRHERSVLRLCRRLLGPGWSDAEDVAQEAFVRAFVGIDRLRRPEAFAGWLHAIAANLAAKARRARREPPLDDYARATAHEAGFDALLWRDELADALAHLSAAQREAVVAHLAGFSYREIAYRTGVPVSTVRGRVFQSRLRLRTELASESIEREETSTVDLVAVRPAVYGTFRRSTDRVLVLHEVGGTRELPIRLPAADAAAVEGALEGSELPERAPHDLSHRLLQALGALVERATVRDVGGDDCRAPGFYATVTVAGRELRSDVTADVAAGIALAARDRAPVVVPDDVFGSRAWDPADVAALRRRDAAARRRLLRRIATGDVPDGVPALVLPPDVERDVAAVLDRLAASAGVWAVLLEHASGALQAWRGNGEESTLALHAAAAVGDDDELAELTTNVVYPSARVLGGVRFDRVAGEWQLETAVAEDWSRCRWEEFEPTFVAARNELESLLRRTSRPRSAGSPGP